MKDLRATLSQRDLSALVANYLAALQPNSRIATVRELARRLGASVGAVQTALARLDASGAVTLRRRTSAGTVLEALRLPQLWVEAHQKPMVVALPPPNTPRVQGLATGIKAALTNSGIETYLIFSRGSRHRVRALHGRACDAVIMSGLAARAAIGGADDTIAVSLPVRTYAGLHRVYSKAKLDLPGRPVRVACDPDSADLQLLVGAEFEKQPFEYVDGAYLLSEKLLREGAVDVVLWDQEDAPVLPGEFVSRSLSPRVKAALGEEATRAVVVTRSEDAVTTRVLAECLVPSVIVGIQEAVLNGRRAPEY